MILHYINEIFYPYIMDLSYHDAEGLFLNIFVRQKIKSGNFKTRLFTADIVSYFEIYYRRKLGK